ncbi:MAG: class I SAM-dependent methyltransferase [Enterobacteriaceae bacterium]
MKPAQISRQITAPVNWAELPWGEYYRETLQQQLTPWLPKLIGDTLLKLGPLSMELATDKCLIPAQFSLSTVGSDCDIIADIHQLPFINKSVNACLMAHILCYSADPHAILREVDRVMVDDGWLIVSNFNPFSLLGVGSLLPWMKYKQPYCSRMFTLMRLLDWLQLLNYEIMYHHCCQLLPWSRQKNGILSRHFPALGCLSLIIARKRTIPLRMQPLSIRERESYWGGVPDSAKSYRDNLL